MFIGKRVRRQQFNNAYLSNEIQNIRQDEREREKKNRINMKSIVKAVCTKNGCHWVGCILRILHFKLIRIFLIQKRSMKKKTLK